MANCDVCGKYTAVTEPRDFGTPPTIDFAEPHTWAASPDEPYCAEPRNLEDETPVVKVTPQPCVCIPLAVQEANLWYHVQNGLEDRLHDLIDDHWDELVDLMVERLRGGYTVYGSEMYGWPEPVRLKNALEEVADCGVYLSAGPIE
jgi:hypothetical protein